MSMLKNKGLWLGAGALGCFGMVMVAGFIVVGGIALFLMGSDPAPAGPAAPVQPQGFAPDNGQAAPEPVYDPGAAPASATVTVEGRVVDENTQQGIPGAYFMVMTPGKTFAELSANPSDKALLRAGARTDGNGDFRISDLERGYTYTVVIAAEGYRVQGLDHALEITGEDPEVTRLNAVPLVRE